MCSIWAFFFFERTEMLCPEEGIGNMGGIGETGGVRFDLILECFGEKLGNEIMTNLMIHFEFVRGKGFFDPKRLGAFLLK